MTAFTDLRVRSKLPDDAVRKMAGKVLTEQDYDVKLTGPTFIRKPDGSPLAAYLPSHLNNVLTPEMYRILHGIQGRTDNRGLAAGSPRTKVGTQKRARTLAVPSSVLGATDPTAAQPYCRLTSWTGTNLPEWEKLAPLFQRIADTFKTVVPDRYAAQARRAQNTDPAWVVPGTPFTTITVNNTYSTGVHTDSGDLPEGFSTLGVIRRGDYTGGTFVFPQYRIAIDMRDGDLCLMDAHEYHGNTRLYARHRPGCTKPALYRTPISLGGTWPERDRTPDCEGCKTERISLVCYYRTNVEQCGTSDEEMHRAQAWADRRSQGDYSKAGLTK